MESNSSLSAYTDTVAVIPTHVPSGNLILPLPVPISGIPAIAAKGGDRSAARSLSHRMAA
jgi:hypothetical protein